MKKNAQMNRLHALRHGFSLLLLLLLVFAASFALAEGERRVVRVAFPEQRGMSEIDNTGKLMGYNYDYLEKISEYTGWQMEYITYPATDANDSVMNAMQDLSDGKVDLLGPMLKNDATLEMYEYPQHNYGTVYTMLCVDMRSTLRRSNLDMDKTYRIGLYEKAAQRNSEVLAYLESDNIPYEIVYYPSVKEQLEALRSGEVDMVSAVSLSPYDNTRVFATFAPRPYYFVSTKGNSGLIAELDEAIVQVSTRHVNLQDSLFDRYFGERVDYFSVSEAEQEIVDGVKAIRVLCVDMDAPYAFIENGQPKGALVTVINNFAGELGIQVEYTLCGSRAEAEPMLADGAFDFVVGMPFPSSFCAENGYVRSDPVFTSGIAYIRNNYSDQYQEQTIALVRGLEGGLTTSAFKKVDTYDTMLECVEAVQSGKADVAAGNQSMMEYYLNDTGSSLLTFSVVGRTNDVCIAASRKTMLPLLGVLNNYVNSLSVSEKNNILSAGNSHSHVREVMASLRRLINRHPWVILVAAALLVLIISLKARRIHREKQRLEEVNHALEQAKAASEAARVELEKASVAKSNFLFNMSHDIRTPMNAIIGYSELIRRKLDDPELLDYEKKVENASNLLLSIINNVLDMARIESGKVELNEEVVNTGETMDELLSVFEKIAESKEIRLESQWDVQHNCLICDQTKIKEVFLNLISNAVKYTQKGGTVSIRARELPCDREGYVRIESVVEDTGIGMSEEYLPQLFDPFTRERNTTTSQVSGTGLGMPIVKKLVELMGGTIEVESQPGKGTKFTMILEHKLADEDCGKQKKAISDDCRKALLAGKRILLAEDNDLNAEIAQLMLTENGFLVERVADGAQCVAKVEQMPAGSYDVILMDIQMPNMDGYQAARAIRALADPAKASIPMLAMTANAFAEDRKNALAAGMNGHLPKPIDINKIEAAILSVLTGTGNC
ncbi:MAG: ATP-binding protein [Clostridia bacterium]|nr:ATP-binding protein [Clostridia bacterium]